MCFDCSDEQAFQDRCGLEWSDQMRAAAEAECGLTCDGSLSCPWQFANNPNTKCCKDASAGEPEACGGNYLCITTVDEPDAITSYCVPGGGLEAIGGEQEFQNECGKWPADLKAAAEEQTGLTCDKPVSCEYQVANSVPGFECCDDQRSSDCKNVNGNSNAAICLIDENIKSSACIDCNQFNKQCQKFWNNDYLMDLAEKKCGKKCYLNDKCDVNPRTYEKPCKNYKVSGDGGKCVTRVELSDSNGYYYQCVDGSNKCVIDSRAPDWSCDPKRNSMYDTGGL